MKLVLQHLQNRSNSERRRSKGISGLRLRVSPHPLAILQLIRSNISNTGMVFVETVPIVHEIMLHQPSFCRSHCRRRQRGRGWGWPTFHAVCTNHSHECHKQHVGYFDIECFFSLAGRYMFQNAAKLCICGDLLIIAMNDAFHTKHVPYNS